MIVFKAHGKPVYALAFSPDGRSLVTSGGDEAVRLWALDQAEEVRAWPGSKFVAPVAISPDGRFIGRGGYGVRVWQAAGPETPVVSSDQYTESVAFSPRGDAFIAHGNSSHSLSRWALPTGKPLPGEWGGNRESNDGNQFPTGGVAYHPDGSQVAACYGVLGPRGFDSVVYLWDAKTGRLLGTLRAGYSAAHPTAIAFSPDGGTLAGVYGPALRIWDVRAEKEIASKRDGKKHFKGLVFTPDGRWLVTVSNDATARVWETANWTSSRAFAWKIGKLATVNVSADGYRLAAGGSSGKVIVWDADT